jgi:hypothetical protein
MLKKSLLLIPVLALAACAHSKPAPAPNAEEPMARGEVSESGVDSSMSSSTTSVWQDQRSEYIRKTEERINQISLNEDKMRAQHSTSQGDRKKEMMNMLDKLEKQVDKTRDELNSLREAKAEDYSKQKNDVDAELNKLEDIYSRTTAI